MAHLIHSFTGRREEMWEIFYWHPTEPEQAGRAGARRDAKVESESDWCPHHN